MGVLANEEEKAVMVLVAQVLKGLDSYISDAREFASVSHHPIILCTIDGWLMR